jgi:hypothetical protein
MCGEGALVMELGFRGASALNLLKLPFLTAHFGEGTSRERRSTLQLHKAWEAARGSKRLPSLLDFDLTLIERVGGGCFLLDFQDDGTPAKFRYFGRDLAASVQQDFTGYSVAAVQQRSLLTQLISHCAAALQSGRPIGLDGLYAESPTEHLLYRSILLPFAKGGDRAECVLGCLQSRSLQARPSIAPTMMRSKSPLTMRLEPVPKPSNASSVTYPEQFKAAVSRARQQANMEIAEGTGRAEAAERSSGVIQRNVRRAIWSEGAVQVARSAPAIGKAVLPGRDSEFALLLARRIDGEKGRYEIVAEMPSVLLNMALRSVRARSHTSDGHARKRRRKCEPMA